jgi:short-subunit dehydrogenase
MHVLWPSNTRPQMCQACYKQMVAQGGGKIVNIGSLTGLQPVPLRGVYSATKAAVQRLTDAMRIELGPLGVQVARRCSGQQGARGQLASKPVAAREWPPSQALP